jgi:hypothetical protein
MGNKNLKSQNNYDGTQRQYVLYLGTRSLLNQVRGVQMSNGIMLTKYDSNIVWSPEQNEISVTSTKNTNLSIKWPGHLTEKTYLQCWGEVGETLDDHQFLDLLGQISQVLKQ